MWVLCGPVFEWDKVVAKTWNVLFYYYKKVGIENSAKYNPASLRTVTEIFTDTIVKFRLIW